MSRRPTLEFGTERECPRCRNVYSTRGSDLRQHWYSKKTQRKVDTDEVDEDGDPIFERREVEIPSTYCKRCTNEINVESRRNRHRLMKLTGLDRQVMDLAMRGICACCGTRRQANTRRLLERPDGQCYALCKTCWDCAHGGMSSNVARHFWKTLFVHNAWEAKLTAYWATRSDRRRKPHTTYPRDRNDLEGRWGSADAYYPELNEGGKFLIARSHVECIWRERSWRAVVRWLAATEEPLADVIQLDDARANAT